MEVAGPPSWGVPRGLPLANRNSSALVAFCPGQYVNHGRSDTAAYGSSVGGNTIAVTWWCQWVFSGGGAKNCHPGDPRQVEAGFGAEPGRRTDLGDGVKLSASQF